MGWLSKITGRHHHFKIALRYYPDASNGEVYVERRGNVWTPNRRDIANDREIKRHCSKVMFRNMPDNMKRNGELKVTEVYYLGWFRPIEKVKPKRKTAEDLILKYLLHAAAWERRV